MLNTRSPIAKIIINLYYIYNFLYQILLYQNMNAFDKHRKNLTAWCEDCNEVFDVLWTANLHRDQMGHKIKVTEFWITGR